MRCHCQQLRIRRLPGHPHHLWRAKPQPKPHTPLRCHSAATDILTTTNTYSVPNAHPYASLHPRRASMSLHSPPEMESPECVQAIAVSTQIHVPVCLGEASPDASVRLTPLLLCSTLYGAFPCQPYFERQCKAFYPHLMNLATPLDLASDGRRGCDATRSAPEHSAGNSGARSLRRLRKNMMPCFRDHIYSEQDKEETPRRRL